MSAELKVADPAILIFTGQGPAPTSVATNPLHTSPPGGSLSSEGSGLSPSTAASPSTSATAKTAVPREPDPDTIKMFVGQVPRSYDEATLRTLFEEYGAVHQLNVLRDKATMASRGCCFVTFFKRADSIAAQAALHNVKVLPGMHHPIQMKPADSENRNERKLFVGMLSKKYNESDVRAMFIQFGHIEDCSVLRDPNANSKGCAFVTFASRPCAANAIKATHHSQTMEGCSQPIVVKFADTQKEKEQKKAATVAPPTLASIPTAAPVAALPPSPLQAHLALLQQTNAMQSQMSMAPSIQQQLMQILMAQQQPQLANPLAAYQLPGAGLGQLQTTQASQFQQQLLLQQQLAAQQSLFAPTSVQSQPATTLHSSYANQGAADQNGLLSQLLQSLAQQTAPAEETSHGHQDLQGEALLGAPMMAAPTGTWQPFGLPPNHHLLQQLPAADACGMGVEGVTTRIASGLMPGKRVPSLNSPGLSPLEAIAQAYPASALAQLSGVYGAAAAAPANGGGKQTEGPDGANLFIYHLPQEFTDPDLAQTFAPFGNVLSAKIFIDKQTNLSKCFGFVSYDNPMSANAAISAMNGFAIGTKRLKVQLKRSKSEGKPYAHPAAATALPVSHH